MAVKQHWDPQQYVREAGFVARYGIEVLALLKPQTGERILDLGCGDGALTQYLVQAGCQVVAVDSSVEQVAAARARGLDATVVDGHKLQFEPEFDAVFSNAALHWMKDQHSVLRGVRHALRPGGRFVGELGAAGNVGKIVAAIEQEMHLLGLVADDFNPWYFPTVREYQALLEACGFTLNYIEKIPRPTPLPSDIVGWLELFAESFISAVPALAREGFLTAVRTRLQPELLQANGQWLADYVRLRFEAFTA